MGRPDNRTGTWMLIHQATSSYLLTYGYDPTLNENVHVWNEYPLRTEANRQGHLWDLTKQKDGSYLISTSQHYGNTGNGLFLEAPTNTDQVKFAHVKQQYQKITNNDLQSWILEPVSNDNKTYAIRPKMFAGHALGLEDNQCINNKWIIASPTYGKPTYHHYWRLYNPFK